MNYHLSLCDPDKTAIRPKPQTVTLILSVDLLATYPRGLQLILANFQVFELHEVADI